MIVTAGRERERGERERRERRERRKGIERSFSLLRGKLGREVKSLYSTRAHTFLADSANPHFPAGRQLNFYTSEHFIPKT